MIKIQAGDTEFQKTLSELEKAYIHRGQNWIDKMRRETEMKALHSYGKTLDDLAELPDEEGKEIWNQAMDIWNAGQ